MSQLPGDPSDGVRGEVPPISSHGEPPISPPLDAPPVLPRQAAPPHAPDPPPAPLEYRQSGAAGEWAHPGYLAAGIVCGIGVSIVVGFALSFVPPLPGGRHTTIVSGFVAGALCVIAGIVAFRRPRRRWFLAGVLMAMAVCAMLEGICFGSFDGGWN